MPRICVPLFVGETKTVLLFLFAGVHQVLDVLSALESGTVYVVVDLHKLLSKCAVHMLRRHLSNS